MGCWFSSEPSYRERPRRSGGGGTQFCQHGFNINLPRTPCPGCEHHDGDDRWYVVPPMGRGGGRGPGRNYDWDLVGYLRQTPHGYEPSQFYPFGRQGRQQPGRDHHHGPQRPPQKYAGVNVYPHGRPPPQQIDPYYLDEGLYRTRERISKSEAWRWYPDLMDEAEQESSYGRSSRSGAGRSRRGR